MVTKNGFTLIEILIAILILAFMASMTGISIQRSIKIKAKVEKEIDDDAQLREAVSLLVKDINLAFQWVDVNELVKKQIIKEYQAQGKPNPFETPGQIPQQRTQIPLEKLTAFEGSGDAIKLTTLSHERTQKNTQESDQALIHYYLKNVRSYKDKKMSQALVRSVSTFLDGDLEKQGKETVVIENVKRLKFRFLPSDITDQITDASWTDTWKSYDTLDEKTLAKFPAAVEINLEIERDGRKTSISTIASLNMVRDPIKLPDPPKPQPSQTPGPSAGGTNR